MRKMCIFALIMALALSLIPSSLADSDNVLFIPSISDEYSNSLEYTSINWMLFGEARAAIAIILAVDVDNSSLYNGSILSEINIPDSYVGYDGDDMLVVMYPYKNNGIFTVMYTPGYGLASYLIIDSIIGTADSFIEGFMDSQGYPLYYKNTLDDVLTMLNAFLE